VLGIGFGLGLVGIVLIAILPLGAVARACMAVLWCATTTWELAGIVRAWRNCQAMRLTPDGDLVVLGGDREWHAAALAPGSVLLPRIGWMRLRVDGGPPFGELVRGERRCDRSWRRLHVIWRHFQDSA
jgi:hypothetical protein